MLFGEIVDHPLGLAHIVPVVVGKVRVGPLPVVADMEGRVQVAERLEVPGVQHQMPEDRPGDVANAERNVADEGRDERWRHDEAVVTRMRGPDRRRKVGEGGLAEPWLDGSASDRRSVMSPIHEIFDQFVEERLDRDVGVREHSQVEVVGRAESTEDVAHQGKASGWVERSEIEDRLFQNGEITQPRIGAGDRLICETDRTHIDVQTRIGDTDGAIDTLERDRLGAVEIIGDSRPNGRNDVSNPHRADPSPAVVDAGLRVSRVPVAG